MLPLPPTSIFSTFLQYFCFLHSFFGQPIQDLWNNSFCTVHYSLPAYSIWNTINACLHLCSLLRASPCPLCLGMLSAHAAYPAIFCYYPSRYSFKLLKPIQFLLCTLALFAARKWFSSHISGQGNNLHFLCHFLDTVSPSNASVLYIQSLFLPSPSRS